MTTATANGNSGGGDNSGGCENTRSVMILELI
jgi:hypothetical protein